MADPRSSGPALIETMTRSGDASSPGGARRPKARDGGGTGLGPAIKWHGSPVCSNAFPGCKVPIHLTSPVRCLASPAASALQIAPARKPQRIDHVRAGASEAAASTGWMRAACLGGPLHRVEIQWVAASGTGPVSLMHGRRCAGPMPMDPSRSSGPQLRIAHVGEGAFPRRGSFMSRPGGEARERMTCQVVRLRAGQMRAAETGGTRTRWPSHPEPL